MPSEQEFCLRWNEHKSTLITIFESLLESDILVDCTLAAEGQCLKAHKVVLSACSPYFQFLLTQHTDKHPIIILKDVKFEELRAMIDYMYRGEVNIPEDQLGPLLKAAESLQIRGLGGASVRDKHGTVDKPSVPNLSKYEKHSSSPQREVCSDSPGKGTSAAATRIIQTDVRKGSSSPVPRKRMCSNQVSKVESESPSKTVVEQTRQVSPLAEVAAAPSSSLTSQTVSAIRASSWDDVGSNRPPSLQVPSDEKEASLVALPSFGHPLEEPSRSGWVCDMELKSLPATVEELSASGGLPQGENQGSEVLLVPKTEYVEIDDDSLTNAMLDEVQDMDASGPSHGDGAPGGSGFVPWLQNIEGMAHSLVNQEASGSYQASQVCETSQILPRRREDIQVRNSGSPPHQNSTCPGREYKKVSVLRRMKKDDMSEEDIYELRRYEREIKRRQRARRAAQMAMNVAFCAQCGLLYSMNCNCEARSFDSSMQFDDK